MKKNKKIIDILKKRENENLAVINSVEQILKKQRGYVFKMPRKNTPVIMMLSGGLDSVNTVSWLIETYKLVIYPLFIDRGQSRVQQEEDSVRFFEKYFLKKYPKNFKPIFKMTTKVPPHEIRKLIIMHAGEKVEKSKEQRKGIPLFSSLLASYAVQYAFYLEYKDSVKIRTIFRATLASDSIYMAHESLTSVRTTNLSICTQTNDFNWQFTAPLIEKELNYFLDKPDLIQWSKKINLPIERTWSCYMDGKNHCGACDGCYKRIESFKEAKIKDKTIYGNTKRSLTSEIKDLLGINT